MTESISPSDEDVKTFWTVAREVIEWVAWEPFIGQAARSTMVPPSVQFSTDANEASVLAEEIVQGLLTSSTNPLSDYPDGETDLPKVGDLSIVCDGQGRPVALIVVKEVKVIDNPEDAEDKLLVETFACLYPAKTQKKGR